MSWFFLRVANGFLFGWFGGGAILRGDFQLFVLHLVAFVIGRLILLKLQSLDKNPPAQ